MVESKRAALAEATEDGAVVLAVCGGYQLLGSSYQLDRESLPGLGLVDLETVRSPGPRLIGNVAIEVDLGSGPQTVAGFENHGGRTHLGPGATPLGRVLKGFGNNGEDGFEGVRRNNLIGTYLHGPLLPKNAWLADHLIALALERRYGDRPQLEPLDDGLERAAHESARRAALGLAAAGAEAAVAARGVGQRLGLDRLGQGDRTDHQLRDAVAGGDPKDLGRVGVEQQDPDLAAVAGVDQAGTVDQS